MDKSGAGGGGHQGAHGDDIGAQEAHLGEQVSGERGYLHIYGGMVA